MKKLFYLMLIAVFTLVNTACEKDFLEVESPSSVDEDFVFGSPSEATKVLSGFYDTWYDLDKRLHYVTEATGSDSEYHPETFAGQTARHIPEGLFPSEGSINDGDATGTWNDCFLLVNRANIMIEALEEKPEVQAALAAGVPSQWSQIYGEAVCHRANAYRLVVRYFGDVPYYDYAIKTRSQSDTLKWSSRDVVYEKSIAAVQKVIPLMYRLGSGGIQAERFSGTYADHLVARMAFDAGGFQTRRTDFDYGNVSFEQWGVDNATWQAKYVRRTDWKDFMAIAKTHYLNVVNNPGTLKLIETDERGPKFNNPFQRNWQYQMDLEVSPESIYESGYSQGNNSDFPYSFGRGSGGGGSNAYPCKAYGQGRLHVTYAYGDFDKDDKRRDVTVVFTANSGAASEILTDFSPGSREKGSFTMNKLDESRMKVPYTAAQRRSGINWQQERMGIDMLMLAYVSAVLGDEATARTYFKKVRSRAFSAANQAIKVEAYVNAMSGDALIEGIQQELKLETGGEGKRRWDMTLMGIMPKKIVELRQKQRAMVAGLKANGYYTFANGLTISDTIWTKKVDIKAFAALHGTTSNLLTTQSPENITTADPMYPVLVPGWRGTSDTFASYIATLPSNKVHLAIRGLFEYIAPGSPTALALEADGYVKTPWAVNIRANESQYTEDIFKGYPDDFYTSGQPPRYVRAVPFETLQTSPTFTQGYGHASE
ncbi:RagB/SusD family nutrient uptake outer membrane protein [Mariniflexile litorale]|uniref:RagB/SusD family nutrient uptake outer membrane protein n=1 Tax=Mariniflexile litorale TaxID=3045158 RepID=A0AAU7EKT0_9FLAO|nr:RagB/SusD family nutrient uptake outer membrane protein [Mariniflexile sp. KMM 9835]MDQ8210662.1 RagB/SusD family nutrient uptake outer membrane protein [Mariniflexile sp. KMM 9835]